MDVTLGEAIPLAKASFQGGTQLYTVNKRMNSSPLKGNQVELFTIHTMHRGEEKDGIEEVG